MQEALGKLVTEELTAQEVVDNIQEEYVAALAE
jgi:hypothetical protein